MRPLHFLAAAYSMTIVPCLRLTVSYAARTFSAEHHDKRSQFVPRAGPKHVVNLPEALILLDANIAQQSGT